MVNGYVTLDLASKNIYKEALGAIKSQKPVMVVDLPNVYFADTISLDGTNIIITKGGKTITIANDNTITNVGDIQPYGMIEFDGIIDPTFITANLNVVSSYVKAVVNYREIQFIFSCRLSNSTNSSVTIVNDRVLSIYNGISNDIKSKIFAHNGQSCEGGKQGSIAYSSLYVSNTQGTYSSDNNPRYVNLFHYDDGSLRFYLEGGSIEIPANTSLDFETRISLAL